MAKLEKVDLGKAYAGQSADNLKSVDSIRTSIQGGIEEKQKRIATEDEAIFTAQAQTEKILKEAQRTAANNNSEVNRVAVGYAQEASSRMLAMTNLYKNGRIKSPQFLTARANIDKGAESVKYMVDNIDTKRKEIMTRMNTTMEGSEQLALAQELEQFIGESLTGIGGFKNSEIVVDDMGNTFWAKKDGKGGISSNPADLQEVTGAIAQMQVKYDNFNLTSFTEGVADRLATIDQGFRHGTYASISDVLQKSPRKKDVEKLMEDKWGEVASNPYNVTSIITNQMDGNVNYTYDKNEADNNPNMLLLEKGADYIEIVEDHKNFKDWSKKAEAKFHSELVSSLDRKTVAAPRAVAIQKQEWQADKLEERQEDVALLELGASLYANVLRVDKDGKTYTDDVALNTAVQTMGNIQFQNPKNPKQKHRIQDMDRTNTGVKIVIEDILEVPVFDDNKNLTGYQTKIEPRTQHINFKDLDSDGFASAVYAQITGQAPDATALYDFRHNKQVYRHSTSPDEFYTDGVPKNYNYHSNRKVADENNPTEGTANYGTGLGVLRNDQKSASAGGVKTQTGYNFNYGNK